MMEISFHIDYQTVFGEEVVLNVMPETPGADIKLFRMSTHDGYHWTYQMKVGRGAVPAVMNYYYSLDCDGSQRRHEWLTEPHRLELSAQKATLYEVFDHWIDIPEDSYLYSSAFTDSVNRREHLPLKKTTHVRTLRLKVRAPQLRSGERLAVTGSPALLGGWSTAQAVGMIEHNYNEWVVDIDAAQLPAEGFELKFVVVGGDEPVWETGANRQIVVPEMEAGCCVVYELPQASFPINGARLAGTCVPVFSLRTEGSFGVGDFGDLKRIIDWVSMTGQRILQVLPINDSTITHTWLDSYPYSCISIFALHPQYADLRQLPALKDQKERKRFEQLQKKLNALEQIDYEAVNSGKLEYLRLLFAQEGDAMMKSDAFKAFFKETGHWLVPYAQYCHLRDTLGTADFSTWKGHETWDEADRKALTNPRTKIYKEVAFYYFVQFILNEQMHAAHEYARQKKVILKGDIPIGVNRNGCDVWMEPKYFNLNGQAGAPPDDFSVNGQNWGFPTYNWDAMIADGCQWWVRRFQNMQKFFDAYRIDHVLGFFRIWEIPVDSVHGLLGQFSPALGLTREEIEAYGLHFQEQLFTEPFIADWTLQRIFGDRKEEIKTKYLDHAHDDIYRLKEAYNTQRKIETEYLKNPDEMGENLRDGLYALVSNVLFVRDRKDANKFHPRITAQLDFMYEALWDSDKAAFNRLYNDYYYRRNNQFWYREAMKKLPRLVQATRMLVCAEDLGMVPDCVAWVMQELRILSLEIQSMPKDPKVRFGWLPGNPYRSVSTISTHDMPTLRQWWDENNDRTQEYFNTMMHQGGPAPHPLPGWLAREIVLQHLWSPSMLCIISLQDWLSIDEQLRLADADAERINIPANPKHYWRYRMHLSVEQLMENQSFNSQVADLVAQTGRKQ